jgi:hypothetical protein
MHYFVERHRAIMGGEIGATVSERVAAFCAIVDAEAYCRHRARLDLASIYILREPGRVRGFAAGASWDIETGRAA